MKFKASNREIRCALTRLIHFTSRDQIPERLRVPYTTEAGRHLLLPWRGFIYVGDVGHIRVWGHAGFVRGWDFPFELSDGEWVATCASYRWQNYAPYPPADVHQIEDPEAYLAAITAFEAQL